MTDTEGQEDSEHGYGDIAVPRSTRNSCLLNSFPVFPLHCFLLVDCFYDTIGYESKPFFFFAYTGPSPLASVRSQLLPFRNC